MHTCCRDKALHTLLIVDDRCVSKQMKLELSVLHRYAPTLRKWKVATGTSTNTASCSVVSVVVVVVVVAVVAVVGAVGHWPTLLRATLSCVVRPAGHRKVRAARYSSSIQAGSSGLERVVLLALVLRCKVMLVSKIVRMLGHVAQ